VLFTSWGWRQEGVGGGDRFAGLHDQKQPGKQMRPKRERDRWRCCTAQLFTWHRLPIHASDTGGTRAHSHKAIWPPKKVLEKVLSSCLITCRTCPSFKHFSFFLLYSLFVHRVHAKSPVFSEGTLQCSSFFGVHNRILSLEQVLRSPDNISSCYTLRLKLPALGGTHRGRKSSK